MRGGFSHASFVRRKRTTFLTAGSESISGSGPNAQTAMELDRTKRLQVISSVLMTRTGFAKLAVAKAQFGLTPMEACQHTNYNTNAIVIVDF